MTAVLLTYPIPQCHFPKLAQCLAALGNPGVGANYDPALAFAHRHDPVAGILALGSHLAGMHVKDVVRSGAGLSGCTEVPLGEGVLDYPALVAAAAGVEYRGPWTLAPTAGADVARELAWLGRVLRG